jgi:hypothetical protein
MPADHGHRHTSSATALVPVIVGWEERSCSGDPALALRASAELLPRRRHRRSGYIELEDTSHRHEGLWPAPILGSDIAKRLYTIDEQAATGPVFVFNDPVPPTVLTNHKNRLSQARGRFGIAFHCSSPF